MKASSLNGPRDDLFDRPGINRWHHGFPGPHTLVTAVHQWRLVPVIFGHRIQVNVGNLRETASLLLCINGALCNPLIFDPLSIRRNVGNFCKLSCISYTCIKKALLRRSSSVQCPNEINVGAMQAIPESREKLSHSSGITWFHLSLAHTSWCYREAIFIRGVRSLGSQEKGDEASSCRIRDRRSESDKSRSVPSRLVPSRINNMPGCTFEGH